MPVAAGTDAAQMEAELESRRQSQHQEALAMAEVRREFGITLREYNQAHGFTPVATHPSRIEDVRKRGKGLNAEIARDGRSSSSKTPSHLSVEKPKYSSPAKTLRAAEAARAELSGLSGEALRKQQDRVNELVAVATRQNEAFRKANTAVGGSQVVHSAGAAGEKSRGQASSPHIGGDRDRSVNSGRNKQMQTYDPVYAGKQLAEQGNAGRGNADPGQGDHNAGQVNPAGHDRKSAGQGQPPRYPVPNPPQQQ